MSTGAHLRARHDLVLIPFTSLGRAFPRSRMIAQAYRTVALLVEMMADDRALRVRGLLARELATALLRFGTAAAADRGRRAGRRGGRADRPGQPPADPAAAAIARRPGSGRARGGAAGGDPATTAGRRRNGEG